MNAWFSCSCTDRFYRLTGFELPVGGEMGVPGADRHQFTLWLCILGRCVPLFVSITLFSLSLFNMLKRTFIEYSKPNQDRLVLVHPELYLILKPLSLYTCL